jgi:hypothetical protein
MIGTTRSATGSRRATANFCRANRGSRDEKKRKAETQAQMIARVRDELVTVNGDTMTKYELAVRSVIAQTIKGGKTRDLRTLFEMLDKYGVLPEVERAAEDKAAADKVMGTIMDVFTRSNGHNPDDRLAIEKLDRQEAELVIGCSHCGPKLREKWNTPNIVSAKSDFVDRASTSDCCALAMLNHLPATNRKTSRLRWRIQECRWAVRKWPLSEGLLLGKSNQ